jgi:hypothetical protein
VPRRLRREPEQERRREREVAGRDDADPLLPRSLVDLRIVGRGEAARADDDGDAPLKCASTWPLTTAAVV